MTVCLPVHAVYFWYTCVYLSNRFICDICVFTCAGGACVIPVCLPVQEVNVWFMSLPVHAVYVWYMCVYLCMWLMCDMRVYLCRWFMCDLCVFLCRWCKHGAGVLTYECMFTCVGVFTCGGGWLCVSSVFAAALPPSLQYSGTDCPETWRSWTDCKHKGRVTEWLML